MLFFVSVRGKLVCADKMYKYKIFVPDSVGDKQSKKGGNET